MADGYSSFSMLVNLGQSDFGYTNYNITIEKILEKKIPLEKNISPEK